MNLSKNISSSKTEPKFKKIENREWEKINTKIIEYSKNVAKILSQQIENQKRMAIHKSESKKSVDTHSAEIENDIQKSQKSLLEKILMTLDKCAYVSNMCYFLPLIARDKDMEEYLKLEFELTQALYNLFTLMTTKIASDNEIKKITNEADKIRNKLKKYDGNKYLQDCLALCIYRDKDIYKCKICGKYYSSVFSDLKWEEISDSWVCPICGMPKRMFINISAIMDNIQKRISELLK